MSRSASTGRGRVPATRLGPLVAAAGVTVVVAPPVFLFAALAVFVRSDLGFTEPGLGQVVSSSGCSSGLARARGGAAALAADREH